jgi:hypothetical protein
MKLYLYQRNAINKCIIINRVDRGWDDDTNQRAAPIKSILSNHLKSLMKLHFHQCSTGRNAISPMVLTDNGISMRRSELQFLNALPPMDVTEDGIMI